MFEQASNNIDDVLWKEAGFITELNYSFQGELGQVRLSLELFHDTIYFRKEAALGRAAQALFDGNND